MVTTNDGGNNRPAWFVGAWFKKSGDQTKRFVSEGIWEHGSRKQYIIDYVKCIKPGDRIAIKALCNTRREDVPFDDRGCIVSAMTIKATGTVTENMGDGRNIKVDWARVDPPREWFFFTHPHTVWKVRPDNWKRKGLIRFAFEGEEQDIDRFRNAPYSIKKFGDRPAG